jgi:hypothetical protein
VFYAPTKHVEIDYNFVLERVASKFLEIRSISTENEIVDEFTKPLRHCFHLFPKSIFPIY